MINESLTVLTLPYEQRTKTVRVYVPAHEEGETLPVVYMTDGQNLFEAETVRFGCWYTREIVRAERENTGRAAIIVGIHNDGDSLERLNELTPKTIGSLLLSPDMSQEMREGLVPCGESFDDFVVRIVMPTVEEQFPVKTGRAYTAFCGSSSGGLQAFFTVLTHQEKFAAGGIFSPAFPLYEPDDLAQWVREHTGQAVPFLYLYAGGADPLEQDIAAAMTSVGAILQETCPPKELYQLLQPDQPHHESAWSPVFADFLHLFLESSVQANKKV